MITVLSLETVTAMATTALTLELILVFFLTAIIWLNRIFFSLWFFLVTLGSNYKEVERDLKVLGGRCVFTLILILSWILWLMTSGKLLQWILLLIGWGARPSSLVVCTQVTLIIRRLTIWVVLILLVIVLIVVGVVTSILIIIFSHNTFSLIFFIRANPFIV